MTDEALIDKAKHWIQHDGYISFEDLDALCKRLIECLRGDSEVMPQLLSDKIEEFIKWLRDNTDFAEWDIIIQNEVWKKLIEIMTSREE